VFDASSRSASRCAALRSTLPDDRGRSASMRRDARLDDASRTRQPAARVPKKTKKAADFRGLPEIGLVARDQ
jgi:hypothetical protein